MAARSDAPHRSNDLSGVWAAEHAVAWLRALVGDVERPRGSSREDRPAPRRRRSDHRRREEDRISEAQAVGLCPRVALALPEKVVLARPTGVGRALATYEIPI